MSKSYVLQHIKTFFLKNKISTNAHDWGYRWGCHTQRKDYIKAPEKETEDMKNKRQKHK